MPTSRPNASVRGIDARGADAEKWLSRLGWRVEAHDGSLRVNGDVVKTESFGVARFRHTPATLRLNGYGRWSGTLMIAVLVISGSLAVTTSDGDVIDLEASSMIVQHFDQAMQVRADTTTAYVTFVFAEERLALRPSPAPLVKVLVEVDSDFTRILTSMVHALFAGDITPENLRFETLRRALETMLAGILQTTSAVDVSRATSGEAAVLDRAASIITAEAADPDFNVEALIRKMAISPGYLHRAFAVTGTTAGDLLRETRVSLALALIARLDRTTQERLLAVAAASGFRSVRTMNRAIARATTGHSSAA